MPLKYADFWFYYNPNLQLLLKAETRYFAPEAVVWVWSLLAVIWWCCQSHFKLSVWCLIQIIAHSSEPATCLMVVQKVRGWWSCSDSILDNRKDNYLRRDMWRRACQLRRAVACCVFSAQGSCFQKPNCTVSSGLLQCCIFRAFSCQKQLGDLLCVRSNLSIYLA